MSVLENAKTHFKGKLSGEMKKMKVDEWQTDIYYKSAYSFAAEQKIIDLQQQGKTVEALVESVIVKALDPEGKPMFTKFDKNALMHDVDPQVLIRVATELNSATSEYETVAKN